MITAVIMVSMRVVGPRCNRGCNRDCNHGAVDERYADREHPIHAERRGEQATREAAIHHEGSGAHARATYAVLRDGASSES